MPINSTALFFVILNSRIRYSLFFNTLSQRGTIGTDESFEPYFFQTMNTKLKMNRFIVIGIILGLSTLTFGQTNEEIQTVVQMCIDLEDFQAYYHEDEIEGRKPLIIYHDGMVPSDLTLIKFGEPVQFMTKEEIFFYNKQAYLDFDKFEISPTRADIEFRYDIEGLTISLTLKKVDGNWTIKRRKLIEQ